MSGAIAMGANKITGLANGTVSTDAAAFGQIGVFYGQVVASAAPVIPSLWLLCDGTTKSRTTYSALFAALCPPLGNPTVTIASPGVFSLTTHGFVNGDTVYLTTTGALPTGLSANTLYYVVVSASNTFELSTTRGGAAINTSGSQSGTHTINACPYGLGNGSTTFNVPNLLGAVPLGTGASGQNGATTHTMGQVGGEETHLLLSTESGQPGFTTGIESADHTHNVAGNSGNGGTQTGIPSDIYNSGQIVTTSGQSATHTHSVVAANAASAHNILPSYQGVKYIIYAGA
jgi:microcystin-dependent protein